MPVTLVTVSGASADAGAGDGAMGNASASAALRSSTTTASSRPSSSSHPPHHHVYAHLVMEEEMELFDEDPTLGRNVPRDFSASDGHPPLEELAESAAGNATSGPRPTPVHWAAMEPAPASPVLIDAVLQATKG